MRDIQISVIIPVYNMQEYLAECLDSVLAQTFKKIEVICVNDGSNDKSADILADYVKKDDRIHVITQKNQGVVKARNNAIWQARGTYIYPLDADDFIVPDTLEKLLQAMIDKKGDIITSQVMYCGLKSGQMKLPTPNKWNMVKGNCLVNAALFLKKDFDKIGGYDIQFQDGLEDYDLWLNFLFKAHKKIYQVPKMLFYYRQKVLSESRNQKSFEKSKGLIKLLHRKYYQMRILSCFVRSCHFFFRCKNGKVRICRIPVWCKKRI